MFDLYKGCYLGIQHSEESNWLWVSWKDTQGYTLCFEGKSLYTLAPSELVKFPFILLSFAFKVTVTVLCHKSEVPCCQFLAPEANYS